MLVVVLQRTGSQASPSLWTHPAVAGHGIQQDPVRPSISSAPKPELERETQMAPREGMTPGAPGSRPEYQFDFETLGRKGTESGKAEVGTEYG